MFCAMARDKTTDQIMFLKDDEGYYLHFDTRVEAEEFVKEQGMHLDPNLEVVTGSVDDDAEGFELIDPVVVKH